MAKRLNAVTVKIRFERVDDNGSISYVNKLQKIVPEIVETDENATAYDKAPRFFLVPVAGIANHDNIPNAATLAQIKTAIKNELKDLADIIEEEE